MTASQAGRASARSGGTCSSTVAPVAAIALDRQPDRGDRLGRRRPDPVVVEPGDPQARRRRPSSDPRAAPGRRADPRRPGPAMIGRTSSRSSTRRAIGPSCVNDSNSPSYPGQCRVLGTRPLVGLIPATPHRWAGWRMLLPLSLPMSNGAPPAATIAAEPPLLPPGRPVEVVRVRGPAVDVVVGLVRPGELGRVRLAQQDPARRPQPRHDRRVAIGDAVAPAHGAGGRDDARRVERVLDRERHAVERARAAHRRRAPRRPVSPGPARRRPAGRPR